MGEGLTTVRHKKQPVMKYHAVPRNWTEYLERPRQRKMDKFGSGQVPVAGLCEHDNELSIKGGEFD
jgi:hypothetical protein